MKLRSLLRTLIDPGWEQARRRRSPIGAVEVGPLVVRRLEERRVLVAPVILASPGATVFAENGPAVQVDPGIFAIDADSMITSVTVTIDGYTGPTEELQFTDAFGVTGGWDSNTGVLTLTGPALFLDFTSALQSVRYLNTSDAPPATRTVTFEATDGLLLSIPDTKTISILRNADTPTVTNANTDEDTLTSSGLVISTDANDGANFYKITSISGGTLFQNDGVTQINSGDFITLGEGAAGLRFLPIGNAFTDPNDAPPFEGRFDVQASTTNDDSGLGGSVLTATITVNAVADTPHVPNATTDEDQIATIVITPNAVDGTSVTHFQITNITNGALFLNDGATAVNNGDFVSVADAAAGLKFTPTPDFYTVTGPFDPATLGSFDVQAVLFGTTLSGPVVQSQIAINPVADTPAINSPTVNEDEDAIIDILPNAIDGSSVTHFKIELITGGQLYLSDGATLLSAGDFIAVADATGLIFRMAANQSGPGTVDARGSTTGDDSGLSGPIVTSNITVLSVPDDPLVTAPASIDEGTTVPISIQRSAVDGPDVTHFRIGNVRHGKLHRDAGRTQLVNASDNLTPIEVLSLFFSPDANYFSDPLNPTTFAGFDVRGSTSGGTLGSIVTVSMAVNPVAESPDIPNAMMFEDGGRVGIPSAPDAVDGSSVTHFQITRIDSGTLRAGAAVLNVGDFITVAQGLTLNFEPLANFHGSAEVRVRAAVDGIGTGLSPESIATIAVFSVPDDPAVTAPASIDEDTTASISIQRAAVDSGDVSHFRITNIRNGVLYRDAGLTQQVNDGDIIDEVEAASLFFRPTQDYFSDPLDPATFAGFDVQGSIGAGGTLGSTVTTSIIVNAVADTPNVPNATTNEDQTATIVITPNAADGASVTHFQITNITNGALFLNDGVTAVNNGDFVSMADAAAGLKFTPTPDFYTVTSPLDPATLGSFDVQAVLFNTTPSGPLVQSQITINPVADTPDTTDATIDEDSGAVAIPVTPNTADGASVTHFQITSITNGTLRAGAVTINAGDFITVAQGLTLNFEPAPNFHGTAEVRVRAAVDGIGTGLSPEAISTISVFSVPNDPAVTAPASIDEDTTASISIQRNAVDGADVSHFRISNVRHGTLYRDVGLTQQVADGDIIDELEASSLFFRPTQDYFSDPLDPATFAGFDVQGSLGAGGTLGSTVTTSIVVNAVADTSNVPNATTDEDQTATIVITPNAADGTSVTHFQITNISNGRLFLNNEVTEVLGGDFVSVANAAAGLKFRPTPDHFTVTSPLDPATLGSFDVQAVLFGTTPSGPVVQSRITINPIADAPDTTDATIDEDSGAVAIPVTPNTVDGSSVTHFQVTSITNGTLRAGAVIINAGDFITVAQGQTLNFEPLANFNGSATVVIHAAIDGSGTGISPAATSTITVNAVNDPPVIVHPNQVDTREETPVAITGIVLSDLDTPSGDLELTLQVTNGALSFGSTTGLVLRPRSNPPKLVTYRGTLADLNAALATLTYTPDDDYYSGVLYGNEELVITVDDLGQTGSGISETNARVPIIVDNINDAPRIANPQPTDETADEGIPLPFDGISANRIVIIDQDTPDTAWFTVWITATGPDPRTNPGLTLDPTARVIYHPDDLDQGGWFRRFSGILADINDALDGLAFTAPDNGAYQISIALSDDPNPEDLISDGDLRTYPPFTVNVNNLPPDAAFVSVPSDALEGQVLTITATASDFAGKFDPLSFSWQVFFQGALHTDGNESTVAFVAAQDGQYFIEYVVSDGDGGTTTITDTVFVRNVSPEINSLRAQPIIRGNTAVRFQINDPGTEGVWRVKVDWGDLQPPEILTFTTRDVLITHFYPTAPDPSAPFAPINISITVFDDDGNSPPVQAILEVVGGLPVPVLRAPIDPPRFEFPPVRFVTERADVDSVPELTSEVIERNRQRFNIDETKPRTFELAVVTPEGEELNSFELGQDELWDLEAFFKDNQLPDGHYRIYLVQKNTRRLLVDAYLRDGHLIDPGEETDGNFDRPPDVSETRANENSGSHAESNETVKREAQLPREFYVNDDDRPRYDDAFAAVDRDALTVDRTLVTSIDDLPLPDSVSDADAVLAGSSQHNAALIAGLTAGMAGATWLVARRARKARLLASPRPHSFSKGARLLRLAQRRAMNWCSLSNVETRG